MTPEKQRIAIAEACGWTWGPELFGLINGPHHASGAYVVPDYPNDLNAMHEAEKVLTEKQSIEYIEVLWGGGRIPSNGLWAGEAYAIARASAPKRAEAFLKVVGKWEET